MPTGIELLRSALTEFDFNHKRPSMEKLNLLLQTLTLEEGLWPSYWADGGLLRKYASEPCVYAFFGHNGEILYIGQTKILGKRFGAHFSEGGLANGTTGSIAFIPVPKESWFEILAIEAYLIDSLRPPLNRT